MWLWMICSSFRSPAGSSCRSGVHPENVCGLEPRQRQDHLLPFHLCHRHQEHPLCLCCRQRHHLTANPQRIQPGVKTAGQCPELSSENTPSRPEIPVFCPWLPGPFALHWAGVCVFSAVWNQTQKLRWMLLKLWCCQMFTVKPYNS